MWGPAPISARRLRALVRALPAEGALARALGVPGPGEWGVTEELLATVAEITHGHASLFLQANSKKGTAPPKPLRIPRPARRGEETRPKAATPDEVRKFFGASARYHPKGEG